MLLPPGLDEFKKHVQGHLSLTVGDVTSLTSTIEKEKFNIRVAFWGEEGKGIILCAENSTKELKEKFPVGVKYSIVVPPDNFSTYLNDSRKQKFYVLDPTNNNAIGYVQPLRKLIKEEEVFYNESQSFSLPFKSVK
jgi:hypothetical protein